MKEAYKKNYQKAIEDLKKVMRIFNEDNQKKCCKTLRKNFKLILKADNLSLKIGQAMLTGEREKIKKARK